MSTTRQHRQQQRRLIKEFLIKFIGTFVQLHITWYNPPNLMGLGKG